MKEKPFENKVKKLLEKNGAWFVKFFANGFTKRGVPDLLACVNGRFLAIEVKGDDGAPTDLQLYNLALITKAGGYGVVAYPEDFQSLSELVEALTRTDG